MIDNVFLSNAVSAGELSQAGDCGSYPLPYGGVCSPNGVLTLLGYWDLKEKGTQRNFCVQKGSLSSKGESTESQASRNCQYYFHIVKDYVKVNY